MLVLNLKQSLMFVYFYTLVKKLAFKSIISCC